MLFIIWPFCLLQFYFAYFYWYTLYLEARSDKEKYAKIFPYLVAQFVCYILVACCALVWSKWVMASTPYRDQYLALMIVLAIGHARFLFSYLLIRFKPWGYVVNHYPFLIAMGLLVAGYLIEIPHAVRRWYPLLLPVILLCHWPTVPSVVLGVCIVLFIIGYYQDRSMDRYKTWWYVPFILSIMIGLIQVAIHRKTRSILHPPAATNKADLAGIEKINVLEEYYLINHRASKLTKRPICTPTYLEFFRLHTDTRTLPESALREATHNLYPSMNDLIIFPSDTGMMIQYDQKKVDIIFRGTQNVMEWLGNLGGGTFVYSKTDKAYKHAQIGKRVKDLTTAIVLPALATYDNITDIRIYGHSRGSTMAVYCAHQIARAVDKVPIELFLYAPPPLLDPRLTASPNIRAHTIIDKKDILMMLHSYLPIGTSLYGSVHTTDMKVSPYEASFLARNKQGGYDIDKHLYKSPPFVHTLQMYHNQARTYKTT